MISYIVALSTVKAAECDSNADKATCIGDTASTDMPCFFTKPDVCDSATVCNQLEYDQCLFNEISHLSGEGGECIGVEKPGGMSSCEVFDCKHVTTGCESDGDALRLGEHDCFYAVDGCRAAEACEEVTKNNCASSGFDNCGEPTDGGSFCVTAELHCADVVDKPGCENVGDGCAIDGPCDWTPGTSLSRGGSCAIATDCSQLVEAQCLVNVVTKLPNNVDCIGTEDAGRTWSSCESFQCKYLTSCGDAGEGFVVDDYNCFNDSVVGCREAATCEEHTAGHCNDLGIANCAEEGGACITTEVTTEEVIGSISRVALTGVGALIVSALF